MELSILYLYSLWQLRLYTKLLISLTEVAVLCNKINLILSISYYHYKKMVYICDSTVYIRNASTPRSPSGPCAWCFWRKISTYFFFVPCVLLESVLLISVRFLSELI